MEIRTGKMRPGHRAGRTRQGTIPLLGSDPTSHSTRYGNLDSAVDVGVLGIIAIEIPLLHLDQFS